MPLLPLVALADVDEDGAVLLLERPRVDLGDLRLHALQ
jgi:hypothetical protein